MSKRMHLQTGLSLVEAVAAIVIIGVCLGGIMHLMSDMLLSSSKTVEKRQALLIASSYMEEIMSKPTTDPVTGTVCDNPGPSSRALFMKVCDYNNLFDQGARDQFGNLIPGLGNYQVSVVVTNASTNPTTATEAATLPMLKYGALGLPGSHSAGGSWQYLRVEVGVTIASAIYEGSGDTFAVGLSGARYIISPPPYFSPLITTTTTTPPIFQYP